ncbi:MAG: tryptophan--tRNA ligase, partial [Candidatus Eisenbacteria bacterium]|nr:tryptophan--tRNA ligase [Candidatus Eisenbacteria bacterium]
MNRVFSGIQPTGTLHLGNYLGAVANWVALQENTSIDRIYCVVDYHAITADYDPKDLMKRSVNLARDLLACGLDPEKSALFVQSQIPEHTELAWIFQACTSYGELQRMTQFKSKGDTQSFVSAGLFTYPVLQAADILLYDANMVPVGEDQVQHLELTRGIARRFNTLYGECFPDVKPLLTEAPRIMSLKNPEQKMSKSSGEGHFLALDAPENETAKMIKRAVTDTGPAEDGEMSPGVANLFTILKALGATEAHTSLMADYEGGSLRYG